MQSPSFDVAYPWLRQLQAAICSALESVDGGEVGFIEDPWERDGGGGGHTRVFAGGKVFEKAGVNTSHVYGELDPAFAGQLPGDGTRFSAAGLSLVIHPRSPRVPAVHANIRLVQRGSALWTGGGTDLTPYYPRDEDCVHFHRTLRDVCNAHDPLWYARFKQWCDVYFALPHRGETRGIGGIFYDYVGVPSANLPAAVRAKAPLALDESVPIARAWDFTQDVGRKFLEAYIPIVQSRKVEPWTEAEREFQLYRRGRYAEFNLLYDRGTQFGLRTHGRVESILMSMPPLVRWTYDYRPAPGSAEERLGDYLQPRDWVSLAGV